MELSWGRKSLGNLYKDIKRGYVHDSWQRQQKRCIVVDMWYLLPSVHTCCYTLKVLLGIHHSFSPLQHFSLLARRSRLFAQNTVCDILIAERLRCLAAGILCCVVRWFAGHGWGRGGAVPTGEVCAEGAGRLGGQPAGPVPPVHLWPALLHLPPRATRTPGERLCQIIIIDNFCIVLFSGVHKLTALYNILQHFLSFTNIIHIIMTTNNV